MPNEAEEYEYGQFRWSPFGLAHKRVTNVPQVGFVGQTEHDDNSWHYLGILELQGSVALAGAMMAALSATLAF